MLEREKIPSETDGRKEKNEVVNIDIGSANKDELRYLMVEVGSEILFKDVVIDALTLRSYRDKDMLG